MHHLRFNFSKELKTTDQRMKTFQNKSLNFVLSFSETSNSRSSSSSCRCAQGVSTTSHGLLATTASPDTNRVALYTGREQKIVIVNN
jgi:hypothetical protein